MPDSQPIYAEYSEQGGLQEKHVYKPVRRGHENSVGTGPNWSKGKGMKFGWSSDEVRMKLMHWIIQGQWSSPRLDQCIIHLGILGATLPAASCTKYPSPKFAAGHSRPFALQVLWIDHTYWHTMTIYDILGYQDVPSINAIWFWWEMLHVPVRNFASEVRRWCSTAVPAPYGRKTGETLEFREIDGEMMWNIWKSMEILAIIANFRLHSFQTPT